MKTGYYFPLKMAGQHQPQVKTYFGPFPTREEAKNFSAFHHDIPSMDAPTEYYTEAEINAVLDDPGRTPYEFLPPTKCLYGLRHENLSYQEIKRYWDCKQAEAERQARAGYPDIPSF